MTVVATRWCDYTQPFGIFGPLMSVADIVSGADGIGLNQYREQERLALSQIANWAHHFLARPNAQLGRKGDVCPFVGKALSKSLFRATAVMADVGDLSAISDAMIAIREVFADMHPCSRPPAEITEDHLLKAIIVLFPRVTSEQAPLVIDRLQRELKPSYIADGFMVGEFHPTCPTSGLHNQAFRPLQAPVPALAVRHVTKWDAPFVVDDDAYLRAFIDFLGDEGRRRLVAMLDTIPVDRQNSVRRLIA